jgi:hypothetical protein
MYSQLGLIEEDEA